MASKPTHNAKPIPSGTHVSWGYRGTRGHGTISSVEKPAATAGKIEYNIRETDHHPGEPAIVHHYGSDIRRA